MCVRLRISGLVLNQSSPNWYTSLKGSWPRCLLVFLETNVFVPVCRSVCLHPCGFPHDFETDIIGLVRKRADEDFASPQFECEVSNVAASGPVLEKNARVKFNYLKWTRLKTSGSVSNWARFQLTKHPFYLTKCNMSSEAVPLRLRLLLTKGTISS